MICLAIVASWVAYADAPMDLQDAIAQGLATVTAKSQGGHTGKVLLLEVTNKQQKYVTINVPTGLQFQSVYDGEQDLMVTQGVQMVLGAGATKKITVNAMCIQPSNSSPAIGSRFLVGSMAGDTLVQLAKYIAEHNLQDALGQSAVWTMVRNEGLENVFGHDAKKLSDLVAFMSGITGMSQPWYSKEKLPPPPGQVFSAEPSMLHGTYTFHLDEKGFADLAIYDSVGRQVFLFLEHFEVLLGDNRLKFKLTVKGYKPGKYYARLFLDGELKEEKEFEI